MAETPEERLEGLRFFVIEGDDNFKSHLSRWMQEVEQQIEVLRAPHLDPDDFLEEIERERWPDDDGAVRG